MTCTAKYTSHCQALLLKYTYNIDPYSKMYNFKDMEDIEKSFHHNKTQPFSNMVYPKYNHLQIIYNYLHTLYKKYHYNKIYNLLNKLCKLMNYQHNNLQGINVYMIVNVRSSQFHMNCMISNLHMLNMEINISHIGLCLVKSNLMNNRWHKCCFVKMLLKMSMMYIGWVMFRSTVNMLHYNLLLNSCYILYI